MTRVNDPAARQVVFLDAAILAVQDGWNGLQPGIAAFALGPGGDGLTQIAAILAANYLSGRASISIVGQGSAGQMQIGSATLADASLPGGSSTPSEIGAAPARGGALGLYGRGAAQAAAEAPFVADSH